MENDVPRMVRTPWSEDEIPFETAAEIGTRKVIQEHSTIGLLITTDGSITDIPRQDYIEAEERVVNELKECNKPFVMLLNSKNPNNAETENLRCELEDKYDIPVISANILDLTEKDITEIFSKVLEEFPVSEISFKLPDWFNMLRYTHSAVLSSTYIKKQHFFRIFCFFTVYT